MSSTKRRNILENLEAGLKGSKFRILNELLYRKNEKEMNAELFKKYHEGFQEQAEKWPFNPLCRIIRELGKMDATLVIADFGCGTADIEKKFKERKVLSFDLAKPEGKNNVIEADIRSLPIEDASVDVGIFCLSLMGEDASPYIQEAYRVIKPGGLLKIVEVRSRLSKISHFIQPMNTHGFSLLKKDLESNFFCFFEFKRERKGSSSPPSIALKPCVYKRR
ncbi:ribosomal RNA-processing protein 8 [Nematocida sp. LUAm3]|nr:ribosomal RNA-processing protein 8 [Nematocida sp. LUAm3]KAI5174096.1 ribosomal RNA-processing protein 8 [Nematocida sp. LUAm2]KAI5177161.1 ribosomal RNA-processing protein 8 [Nematocida sp. LUAm1]